MRLEGMNARLGGPQKRKQEKRKTPVPTGLVFGTGVGTGTGTGCVDQSGQQTRVRSIMSIALPPARGEHPSWSRGVTITFAQAQICCLFVLVVGGDATCW